MARKPQTKPDPNQYDLEEAIRRSVAGQAAVAFAQHASWAAQYRLAADEFFYNLPHKATFIGEDLRRYIESKIGSPRHHNAWSALASASIRAWRKLGYIRVVGTAPMTRKTSHARQSMLYKKR